MHSVIAIKAVTRQYAFGCCPWLASNNKNKKFYQFELLELQDRNLMGIEILIFENC
jgi:hypothetical protein